jgi:hypothetical protein
MDNTSMVDLFMTETNACVYHPCHPVRIPYITSSCIRWECLDTILNIAIGNDVAFPAITSPLKHYGPDPLDNR